MEPCIVYDRKMGPEIGDRVDLRSVMRSSVLSSGIAFSEFQEDLVLRCARVFESRIPRSDDGSKDVLTECFREHGGHVRQ